MGLVPLTTWYSSERSDHFTTSDPDWQAPIGTVRPGQGDYRAVRLEGFVDTQEHAGTVPLYHWWSQSRRDHLLTSDRAWVGRVGDVRRGQGDYRLFRIEGYVWERPYAGTTKLASYWNSSRKDNALSAWPLHDRNLGAGLLDVLEGAEYEYTRSMGFLALHDVVHSSGRGDSASELALQNRPGLQEVLGLGRLQSARSRVPVLLLVHHRGLSYRLSAALGSGSKYYLFAGDHYLRGTVTAGSAGVPVLSVDSDYPKSIGEWRWGEFGRDGVDAAFRSGSKTYVFAGSEYIRITRGDAGPGSVDRGYPKSIRVWGWGEFGRDGVDAAFRWGSKTYVFAGAEYIRVSRGDTGSGSVDPGYPKPITEWGWGDFGRGGIDAAFDAGSRTFVFSGGRYVSIRHDGDREPGVVDTGYPAPVSNLGWPAAFDDPIRHLVDRYREEMRELETFSRVMSSDTFRWESAGVIRTTGEEYYADEYIALAARQVDLRRFVNAEGRITASDLQFVVALLRGGGTAQHRWGSHAGDGYRARTSVIVGGPNMGASDLAHELLHGFGALDLYGPGLTMSRSERGKHTLMAAHTGTAGSVLLDPWHRMQYGFDVPQVLGMSYRVDDEEPYEDIPPQTIRLRFATRRPTPDAGGMAVLLPTSVRRSTRRSAPASPQRYFMIEARRQREQDRSGPGDGAVVWFIEHGEDGGLADYRPLPHDGTKGGFLAWPATHRAALIKRTARVDSGRSTWSYKNSAGMTTVEYPTTVDMEIVGGEAWIVDPAGGLKVRRPSDPTARDEFVTARARGLRGQVRGMTHHAGRLWAVTDDGWLWARLATDDDTEWDRVDDLPTSPVAITATHDDRGWIWLVDDRQQLWRRSALDGPRGWRQVGTTPGPAVKLASTATFKDSDGVDVPNPGTGWWLWCMDTVGVLWARTSSTGAAEWTKAGEFLFDPTGWPADGDFMYLGGDTPTRLIGLSADRSDQLVALVGVHPANHNKAGLVLCDTSGAPVGGGVVKHGENWVGTGKVFTSADGAITPQWPPSGSRRSIDAGLCLHVWPFHERSTYLDVTVIPTRSDGTYRFRPFLREVVTATPRRGHYVEVAGVMPPVSALEDWRYALRNPAYNEFDPDTHPEVRRIPRTGVRGLRHLEPSRYGAFELPDDARPGPYKLTLGPATSPPDQHPWGAASNEINIVVH